MQTRLQEKEEELKQRAKGPTTAELSGHSIFKQPKTISEQAPDEKKEGTLRRTTRVYDGLELQAAMRMSK